MAVRNFCIKFGHRTKLITVSSEPEELLRDLKGKIEAKFSVSSDEYSMKLKLDEFQTYVDIDETDSDDIKLLEKGGSISLQTNITNPRVIISDSKEITNCEWNTIIAWRRASP